MRYLLDTNVIAIYLNQLDDLAATKAGEIRTNLANSGMPIGFYDLLIASIAIVNNLTLVTHNTREFEQDRVQIEQYIKQDDYHWLLTLHNDLNGKISLDSLGVEIAIALSL